jgi:hypothetical protein
MASTRKWTEIAVDEDLLIPVVRELLDMAADPSHVEIIHGTNGRLILAEVHLAEHWYRERLKRDEKASKEDVQEQTEVVAPADKTPDPVPAPKPPPPPVIPPAPVSKPLEPSIGVPAAKMPAPLTPPSTRKASTCTKALRFS